MECKVKAFNPISFKDKIVIIGVDYPFKEKRYKTPVGDLAGIYIIGNTVLTFDNHILEDNIFLIFPLSLILSFLLLGAFSLKAFENISKFKDLTGYFFTYGFILILFYILAFTLFHKLNLLLFYFIVFYSIVSGEFLKNIFDSLVRLIWNKIWNWFKNLFKKYFNLK